MATHFSLLGIQWHHIARGRELLSVNEEEYFPFEVVDHTLTIYSPRCVHIELILNVQQT